MVPDCIMKMSWLVTLKMAENEFEHITDEMVQITPFNLHDLHWTCKLKRKVGVSKRTICSHSEGV